MAIDTVVEEVAQNLEEAAEATRQINHAAVAAFLGGTAFGSVLGFVVGFRFRKERLKAEAFAKSEEEIAAVREFYRRQLGTMSDDTEEKSDSLEMETDTGNIGIVTIQTAPKPSVEAIIEERGYARTTEADDHPRPLRPPVAGVEEPKPEGTRLQPIVEEPVIVPDQVLREPSSTRLQWNAALEQSRRSAENPYIIHQDEYALSETGYQRVTFTYYEDDILVDEDEEPISDINDVVGLHNLRFGHGSEDEDVVFIRNDKRRLEIEIMRSREKYSESVLGLDPNERS